MKFPHGEAVVTESDVIAFAFMVLNVEFLREFYVDLLCVDVADISLWKKLDLGKRREKKAGRSN